MKECYNIPLSVDASNGVPVRRGLNRVPQRLRWLAASALSGTFLAGSALAGTLPTGGHYVAGAGSISTAGSAVTVTQSSSRGIVDWSNFSVGKDGKIQFDNGSGATLNRVTGGSLSQIAGELSATGTVYLINPNGVVVGPGGKVLTGGSFVASTRDVSNGQFMAGGAVDLSGSSAGAVDNAGTIVSKAGDVVLVGAATSTSGAISAVNGTATLAAGDQVVLSAVGGPAGVYVAAAGTTKGDVTNSGRIKAAAADLVSAHGNVYTLAGNRTGIIQATGTKTVAGQVWLTADDGAVDVAGTVKAANADGSGGAIVAKGASLTVAKGAVLNAAGKTGHGSIETSGKSVSIGKAKITGGKGGNWTVDPTDLTIDSAAATTIDTALNAGTNVTEQTTATTASGSGTQTTGGLGDIDVDAAISWSTTAKLTLTAFNNITVAAPITVTGGGTLVLTYNNNQGGTSSGGALTFVMGQGSAQFTDEAATPSLYINSGTPVSGNGTQYTLIYNTGTTADGIQSLNNSSGNFALAVPLDATSLGTLSGPLINLFGGNFNGLGNTISNVTVNTSSVEGAQLIGAQNGGTLTNIGLIGGSVTGTPGSVSVGGMVGLSNGSIDNVYATGTVTATSMANVGGLVGVGAGAIADGYASGAVTGGGSALVGGLVGFNQGTVTGSYATGAVSGGAFAASGGLVGFNSGSITYSYATGAVSGGTGSGIGGLVGNNGSSTITTGYYDATTTGQASGTQGDGSIGVTTAVLASATTLAALNGGGAVWANSGNQTTPYLKTNPGPVYLATDTSATPTPYNLVFNIAQLQAINNNLTGNYALAQDIDATGYTGFTPIGETASFSGTFNGLGNAVSNLTINSGSLTNVGLFGQSSGTIENLGLIGGSVFGTTVFPSIMGSLVGFNLGHLINVYSTATVSGYASNAGGLVGANSGSITNAYFGGAITMTAGADAGGLVGFNNGSIDNSYVTGPVSSAPGSGAYVGGVVGEVIVGTVADVYDAGSVIGPSGTTGAVTGLNGGTITNGYWDSDRAGATGIGLNGGTSTGGGALSGSAVFTAASYAGFAFVSTPQSANNTNAWVIVDVDSSLNNTLGAVGATMPMLASEYSSMIQNGHQLQLMALALSASYTIARNIDVSATGSSTSPSTGTDVWGAAGFAPVSNDGLFFTGTLDGQGFTVSGLTINSSQRYAGLIGFAYPTATVKNLTLAGVTVSDSATGVSVGGLAGVFDGTISNVIVNGTITAGSDAGQFATAGVGGLVGAMLGGTVTLSSSSGTVTAGAQTDDIGGLIGANLATVMLSSSSANVTAGTGSEFVGGLVGELLDPIFSSFATGSVNASNSRLVGGLVGGTNSGGAITQSYAAGAITDTGSSANEVGGLIGELSGSSILQSYATGNVTAGVSVGGLVGSSGSGIYNQVYSTGVVVATGTGDIGGLIGSSTGDSFIDAYWDTETSGKAAGLGSSSGNTGTVTAGTTALLQTSLASLNFDNAVWGMVPGKSYPYLCWQFGGCGNTPQVVTGTVYTDGGVTNAGGGVTVNGVVNGAALISALTGGGVQTGANGYYYFLAAPGSIPAGGNVVTYAQNYGSGNAINGAALGDAGGFQTGLDILGNTLHIETAEESWTQIKADLTTATGSSGTVANLVAGLPNLRVDDFAGLGLAIDAPVTAAGNIVVNASGFIDIVSGNSIAAGGSVTLATDTKFVNNAGASAIQVGSGQRWLVYSGSPGSDTDGGLVADFIQYNATYPDNLNANTPIDYSTGTAPLGTGNGLLYSTAPVVTVSSVTKTYDQTTALPTASADYGFTGAVNGDNIVLNASGVTGSFASSNAGSGIVVSVTGLAVTVTNSAGLPVYGYTVNATAGDPIGTIAKATLGVALSGTVTKTYDGTTAATVPAGDIALTGVLSGDTVGVTATTAAYASKNQGSGIDVTVGGLSLSGADSGNYVLSAASYAAAIGTITPATLTYTATDASRTYGQANPTLDGTVTGFVGSDTLANATTGTAAFTSAAGTGSNVGSYAVNGSGLTADNGNYVFVQAAGNATALAVTPATLTYTATGISRSYGQAITITGGTVTGFVGSDTLANATTGTAAFTSAAGTASNVGSYAIDGSGLTADHGNYVFVQAAGNATALAVTPATLTYTALATSRTYGQTITITGGTVTGFVGSDTQANATTGTVAFTTTAATQSNVGHYAVDGSGLTADNGNYVFVQAAGNATALTVTPATLTYTALATSRTYGQTITITGGTVTGFVGTDTQANATTGPLQFSTNVSTLSNVGSYAVDGLGLTADHGNYVFVQAAGNATALTITPATLTIQLVGSVVKTYDGNDVATLTAGNYAVFGGVVGSTVRLNNPSTGTYNTSQVGNGLVVTVGGLALLGANANDYRLASTSVSGAIGQITKAPVKPVVVVQQSTPFVTVFPFQPPPTDGGALILVGTADAFGPLPSILTQDTLGTIVTDDGMVLTTAQPLIVEPEQMFTAKGHRHLTITLPPPRISLLEGQH